ncbi:asparaginase [Specibacter cremeus]|uniref:asparaginase n=1 Tax=Specibacter cremeus TaxID=1629051 RepID=UPI000F79266C|nr:asparaginase [Specibacter cremeus]
MPDIIPAHAPLAVQIRGDLVESVHYGSLAALDADGSTLIRRGDPDALFYPRSALKPLMAVAMVRAGLRLPPEQLALAASSHSGAPEHLAGTLAILVDAGLDASALRNSTDLPYGTEERRQWLADGLGPTQLAQNCSGKHAAMLATCIVNGWPAESYLGREHPLPRFIREVVSELTDCPVETVSTDGCGTEVFAVTLTGMARAFGRLATAPEGTAEYDVAAAMRLHPGMVGGTGRDVTDLMAAVPGLIAKDGFEGVQLVALADGSAVAVKVSDGGDRARLPAAAPALLALGVDPAVVRQFNDLDVIGGGHPVGVLHGLPL